MLADKSQNPSNSRLIGPKPNTLILEILDFVEFHLPEFSAEFSQLSPEKGLTFELVNLLEKYTHKALCPFRFHDGYLEHPEINNSREPDIGVMPKDCITIAGKSYPYNRSFFSFETKILPAPEKNREKEYLVGRTIKGKHKAYGGIERFKKSLHGENLDFCGMIGYVKEHDFRYWHHFINRWIDDLIIDNQDSSIDWTQDDKLIMQHEHTLTARLVSKNRRIHDVIILFHLWIKLNPSSANLSS